METYQETLEYIHSRPKKHRSADLTNMHRILTALGEPQTSFKGIHVTGTNGKGSVTQILSTLIVKQGYKVGTFVSPFIQRFNERIQINLEPISDTDLVYWTNVVVNKVTEIQKKEPGFELVEFELVTAIMLAYFKAQRIDVAVIEVGIGGTHDKTNVFTPLLSIITTVGMDHMQLIGPTLEDIAEEKSGIIQAKAPVVVGRVTPKVLKILQDRATKTQSKLYQLNKDFQVDQVRLLPDYRQAFNFSTATQKIKDIKIQNIATFEVDNMAVALMAFELFCKLFKISVSSLEIKHNLNDIILVGRLEIVNIEPFIILDGAHNPQAMEHLFESVRRDFKGASVHVVAAFMKDKAVDQLLKFLHQQRDTDLYLTTLDMPRAAKKADLQPFMKSEDHYFDHWQEGFYSAYQNASQDDLILVCGSIYLISEMRHYLMEGGHD